MLDCFLHAKHCLKYSTLTLNHHKNPINQVLQYYYSHFTEKETESQGGEVTCPKSHN